MSMNFSLGTHSPMAADPSKPLQMVQGCPASEAFFCRSRAVKSMPHHDLRLVVDASQMVWDEKGLPLVEYRRVGFGEYHGFIGPLQRPVQFLSMCGIVHANGKYLHRYIFLGTKVHIFDEITNGFV